MTVRLACAIGALSIATAAAADSPFTHRDGADSGDTIMPKTSYPLGESQIVSRQLARNVRMHWVEQDLCDRFGCLVVHNDTRFYKVAEFRIQAHLPDGSARWSRNLLEHPLLPTQTVVRLKTAAKDCERPVQFLLKHRKTREPILMEGTTNLCSTPGADNVIRIEVKRPEVTVEEQQPQ